jgi:p-cumate 2,3-dioxygenase beta subunit
MGPAHRRGGGAVSAVLTRPATRPEVEDFLYAEAALLDDWRLADWFALFAPGATYEVPTAGAPDDDDPAKSLFYIADDYVRLRERVGRLGKREAHAEFPHSRTRRSISNVRILSDDNGLLRVACNLVCHRAKGGKVDTYFGHCLYGIDATGPEWKITAKRVLLDMDLLYPGKVSIIL